MYLLQPSTITLEQSTLLSSTLFLHSVIKLCLQDQSFLSEHWPGHCTSVWLVCVNVRACMLDVMRKMLNGVLPLLWICISDTLHIFQTELRR